MEATAVKQSVVASSNEETSSHLTSSQEPKEHELFGQLIHDFGFKRLYASNPEILCNPERVPIWEKQRYFNEKRAKVNPL